MTEVRGNRYREPAATVAPCPAQITVSRSMRTPHLGRSGARGIRLGARDQARRLVPHGLYVFAGLPRLGRDLRLATYASSVSPSMYHRVPTRRPSSRPFLAKVTTAELL